MADGQSEDGNAPCVVMVRVDSAPCVVMVRWTGLCAVLRWSERGCGHSRDNVKL